MTKKEYDQFAHKEMDIGDLRVAYEKSKSEIIANFSILVPLSLEVAQAELVFIFEELYNPKTEES